MEDFWEGDSKMVGQSHMPFLILFYLKHGFLIETQCLKRLEVR